MRRFNPDKELKKIQHGNRNKIIFGAIVLLLIISIGSTYAIYQVRYSKRIIYTKVAPFSNRDINLSIYIDADKKTSFPSDTKNLVYTGINCDKEEVKASWDYSTSKLDIESEIPNKCDVYFETRYRDASGANPPELYQGLIPVTINEETGEIQVANLKDKWYDYDAHEWANAVLVPTEKYNELVDENGKLKDTAPGTVLNLTSGPNSETKADGDILQMYVWIPRYRYKLWNTTYASSNPQEIEIIFEGIGTQKSSGNNNGEWLTHPAFTFGNTELPGVWVGKFEPSEKEKGVDGLINIAKSSIENITILPNKISIVDRTLNTMFEASRGIETDPQYNLKSSEVDTHVMKNMEWGAVAYLSQSIYGIFKIENNNKKCVIDNTLNIEECRIYNNSLAHGASGGNSYDGTITGCSGTSVEEVAVPYKNTCVNGRTWYEEGVKSSTTGNVYGIYDMAGGMWEYVMGNMVSISGDFSPGNSGFTITPDSKYYDIYAYDTDYETHARGHLGDATREVTKIYGYHYGGWNGDWSALPTQALEFTIRSGCPNDNTHSGIFAFDNQSANYTWISFRIVLTAQDGNS